MSEIANTLSELNLPSFLPSDAQAQDWPAIRQRMLDTLMNEEYGILPAVPHTVEGKILEENKAFCAGKSVLKKIELTVTLPNGSAKWPCWLSLPTAEGDHPLFVFINFRPEVPDTYLPSEEICDRGYAVLSFCYDDVSIDEKNEFTTGIDRLLRESAAAAGVPADRLPGKIAIWAWAMSRALDWALTQPGIDAGHVAAIGHSRLGKTALVSSMLDERFQCAISNDSGCSGAAITRGKPGERVKQITHNFPFWFCDAYQQYIDREDVMPFEQDWLLATIAPRLLQVGSALEDEWAAPSHEYLGCVSAGKAWELLGLPGFIHPDRMPEVNDALHEGSVGYHLRPGKHYLSREDWTRYMDFLDRKGWHG